MHGLFCWVFVNGWNWVFEQQCLQQKTRQKYKIFRLIYKLMKKNIFFFFDGDNY